MTTSRWAGLPEHMRVTGDRSVLLYVEVNDHHPAEATYRTIATVDERGDVTWPRNYRPGVTYEELQAVFAIATQHGSAWREDERREAAREQSIRRAS